MQYDLFHAYTVDEHTLFVVSNLRRFALSRFDHEFPHCSQIMQSLEQPEIAYLAGLFHDIAKGRGGDHSTLGAVDAEAFCLEHGLSKYEARTVSWLVLNHLIFSTTAQKKDLGDPDVINEFATQVGDPLHLDYLYILTVADVRGTDPKLWNSWKAQLFRDLYELTKRALRLGLENPIEKDQLLLEKREKALRYLDDAGVERLDVDRVWDLFHDNYFLRYRSSEIAWHTEWLAEADITGEVAIVDIRRRRTGDGVEVALYTPQARHTFAHTTAALDELGLTIIDARLVPLDNGYSIDNYVIMESDERVEIDDARINKIRDTLTRVLAESDDEILKVTRPVTRQARMFTTPTRVDFSPSSHSDETVFELIAADRPGLLSAVGKIFIEHGIDIASAKIMTIGERAEDMFYISDESGRPIDNASQEKLKAALLAEIGSSDAQ
ncbi:MAG: HD domain-containing protein [Pseudomonadota bacterium]